MDLFSKLKEYMTPLSDSEKGKRMRPVISRGDTDDALKFSQKLLGRKNDVFYIMDESGSCIGKTHRDRALSILIDDLSERETLYNLVLRKIQDGICVTDEKGKVLIWNKAIEGVYGVRKEEIEGRYLYEIFPNALDMKVLETGRSFRNIRHSPREGATVLISAAPLKKGSKLLGAVSTDRDIAEFLHLKSRLSNAMDKIRSLHIKMELDEGKDLLKGSAPEMKELLEKADNAAQTGDSVFILGETGTGKEILARYIHEMSQAEGSFISVNSGTVTESTLKEDMRLSEGGTLFLDSVEEMSESMQVKLLKLIKSEEADIRIISSGETDLRELSAIGSFNEELMRILTDESLTIPSLRERKGDIREMAEYFLLYYRLRYSKHAERLDDEALSFLKEYDWPGNVRELKSVMRRLVLDTDRTVIGKDDIPDELRYFIKKGNDLKKPEGLQERLQKIERSIIENEYRLNRGNLAKTAKALDMPRSTLQYKIRKLGLS